MRPVVELNQQWVLGRTNGMPSHVCESMYKGLKPYHYWTNENRHPVTFEEEI
jgi:hypothetical protein